ncbi:MAG: VWA domain-containing protein [Kofleriaceae bacterium]
MKLHSNALTCAPAVVIAVVTEIAGTAGADVAFDEFGAGKPRAPASSLVETRCELVVTLQGAVATVEVRQRIVNSGREPLGGIYELDLPANATFTDFALGSGSTATAAVPVVGPFGSVDASTREVLAADPALVRALPPGSPAQYAITLQPIAPGSELAMTTRFTALAEVRASALRLVLPGRAGAAKLTLCKGVVRAHAGPGTTVERIRINGKPSGRAAAELQLDAAKLTIDVDLGFAGHTPVVWTQSEWIAPGWSASLVTVVAPAVTATMLPRRALLVIDTSRSMELIGRANVIKVVNKLASALPANVQLEAIVYDRTASRVFDGWRSVTGPNLAAIEAAIAARPTVNGSDLPGALAFARKTLADNTRELAMVVVITDGVVGTADSTALVDALDAKISNLDVLAVVLDPTRTTTSPGVSPLRGAINLYGGALVELAVDDLDDQLELVDSWLRPSWLELSMGSLSIPDQVRAGSGFTRLVIHRGTTASWSLTGHGESPIKVAPRPGPAARVAALALARSTDESFLPTVDATPEQLALAGRLRGKAIRDHAFVCHSDTCSGGWSLAVLTATGKVARNRLAMVRGGGPYERITAVDDPEDRSSSSTSSSASPAAPPGNAPLASAIAKITLERLFRDQLRPRAYVCYQRALGLNANLAGTVVFELHMGRGEVSDVGLIGLGDATFDTCLRDSAFTLGVPFPDFSVNADDQTIARYPLTFKVEDASPVIVAGDADSSSPLDIDAIEGGPPRGAIKVDAETPLGGIRRTGQRR